MVRPRGIHTPIKHFTEEDKKNAIRCSKTKYMVNKEWRCEPCGNRNYTMSGKSNHVKTKKHIINIAKFGN